MDKWQVDADSFHPLVMYHYRDNASADTAEHQHDFLQIDYVLSGSGCIMINGTREAVYRGDLVIINSGVAHASLEGDYAVFRLGYDQFFMKGEKKNTIPVEKPVIAICKYPQEIYQCYRSIVEAQEQKDTGWELLSRVRCEEMLVWVLKELSPEEAGNVEDYLRLRMYDRETIVKMVSDYLSENYARHIQVEDMARYTYLSAAYLNRIFREVTHNTPINYLIDIRMQKARQLLEEGNLPVQEVAKRVGYEDPYYFSKLFKKRFHMPPQQYKKEHAK